MADIATLTVKYQSVGYSEGPNGGVLKEVDTLAEAGARVEQSFRGTGSKVASETKQAAVGVSALGNAAKGLDAPINTATAALLKWVARLDAANAAFGRTKLELLRMNEAFGSLSATQQAYATSVARVADALSSVGGLLNPAQTAIQRYGSAIGDLNVLLEAGRINQAQFASAMSAASREYDVNSGAVARAQAAYRELIAAQQQEVAASRAVAESAAAEAAAQRTREAAVIASARAAQLAANSQRAFSGLVGGPPDEFRAAQLAAMRRDAMAVWPAIDGIKTRVGDLRGAVEGLTGVFKHAIGGLVAFAALGAGIDFARSIGDANVEMQKMLNTLNAATGSMTQAHSEFKFLADTADRLGTNLQGSADGYARLAVSALSAGVSTSQLHKAFTGLSEGFAATGRSGDEMNRFLVQLEQGLSQGTIQMRDLRAMSQSFPSAFEIAGEAAKRMGGSLQDFLKNGGLPAQQFFLTFSEIVHEKFATAAVEASNTIVGQMNRVNNALFELKTGQDVLQPLTDMFRKLADALNSTSGQQELKRVVEGIAQAASVFGSVIGVVLKNMDLLIDAVKVLAVIMLGRMAGALAASIGRRLVIIGVIETQTAATIGLMTAENAQALAAERAAAATVGGSIAARGFAGAMSLLGGPVGIATLAIGGLAYAIYKQKTQQDAAEKSVTALNSALAQLPGTTGEANTKALEFARTQEKLAKNTLAATQAQLAQLIAQQQAAEQAAEKLQPASQMFGGRADSRMGASYAQTWASQTASLIDKRRADIEKLQAAIKAAELAIANNDPALHVSQEAGKQPSVGGSPAAARASALDRVIQSLGKSTVELNGPLGEYIKHMVDLTKAFDDDTKHGMAAATAQAKFADGSNLAYQALVRQEAAIKAVDAANMKAFNDNLALQNANFAAQQSLAAQQPIMGQQQYSFQSAQLQLRQQQAEHMAQLQAQLQLAQAQGTPEGARTASTIQQQMDAQKIADAIRYNELLKGQDDLLANQGNVLGGLKAGFADFASSAMNLAESMKGATTQFLNGFADALSNFATTGKASFKDVLRSFAEMVNQMITRWLIMKAIMGIASAFGGSAGGTGFWSDIFLAAGGGKNANGGAFYSPSLSKYSNGVYSSPQYFGAGGQAFANGANVFGEAGPEAIMPLKRDSMGRLGVAAHGAKDEGKGRDINVTYQIDARGAGPDEVAKLAQMREQTIRQIRGEVQHYDRYGYFPAT